MIRVRDPSSIREANEGYATPKQLHGLEPEVFDKENHRVIRRATALS
jgi:hypothetical protein